jgi:Fe-S-cluster-containing dehydrogenase component
MDIGKIVINDKKCTGCRACEYACSFAQTGMFQYDFSLVRISRNKDSEGFYVIGICRHCKEPPCMAVCPVSAIKRDEDKGLVIIDSENCTGCGECLEACPWHVPNFKVRQDIATICNLCLGNPLCVQYCSPGALTFALP